MKYYLNLKNWFFIIVKKELLYLPNIATEYTIDLPSYLIGTNMLNI